MIDDPSLLSAYLDDELDAEGCRAVEAALRDNPLLARELQRLARVRSLVAGLARPKAPAEVPMAVVLRIDRHQNVRRLVRGVGLLSTAAGIFLVLTLVDPSLRSRILGGQEPPLANGRWTEPLDPPNMLVDETPEVEATVPAAIAQLNSAESPPPLPNFQEQFRSLFSPSSARRYVVPVARLDDALTARIGEEVRKTIATNPLFSVVHVADDQEIDGEPSRNAVVFVRNMTADDADGLVKRIEAVAELAAPIRVEAPSPDAIQQLAHLENFELGEGLRGAPLIAGQRRPESLQELMILVPNRQDGLPRAVRPPTETRRTPATRPPTPGPIVASPSPPDPRGADQIVLIWVTEVEESR